MNVNNLERVIILSLVSKGKTSFVSIVATKFICSDLRKTSLSSRTDMCLELFIPVDSDRKGHSVNHTEQITTHDSSRSWYNVPVSKFRLTWLIFPSLYCLKNLANKSVVFKMYL